MVSWLGRAAQLVEIDLRGNGPFGAEAMDALVTSMDAHGRILVKVDEEARKGLSSIAVWRFNQASRSSVTAVGLGAAGMDAM